MTDPLHPRKMTPLDTTPVRLEWSQWDHERGEYQQHTRDVPRGVLEVAGYIPQPPEPGEAAKGGAAGADPFEAGYSRAAETKLYRDRIAALEAALDQAEAERDEANRILRESIDPQYDGRTDELRRMAREQKAWVDSHPTRSARAEARSDGERELLHDRIPVQEGPARAAKSHRAQPPQPGGFGNIDALRAEIVDGLRSLSTAPGWTEAFDVLADRLERKR